MKIISIMMLALLPAVSYAQDAAHKGAHAHPVLGNVNFRNSGNAAAQLSFQRGVALLHSFEYEDAAEAFKQAQQADKSLALAYWLEALTYSHVLWGEEDLKASRAVLARLGGTSQERLARAKTDRERAFGAAVEAFFADTSLQVRATAYADSLLKLAAADPSDHEAAAFAAIGSMFAWYSTPPNARNKYNAVVRDEALRVFRQNAQHPGAAHYLIHFVDMNPQAAKDALEFARAYDKIAPDAEHALHMPSHVYLPLGLWQDVVASNERAWAASRKDVLEKKVDAENNSWHSLDWLQYSYLQLGRQRDARALIDTAHAILKGARISDDNPDARNIVNQLAFRYGMETGKWDAFPNGIPAIDVVLNQPRPNQRSWGFATTAAYQVAVATLRGRNDRAPAETVIRVFRATVDTMPPAMAQRAATLRRLASQLEAQLAFADGNHERAITLLREIAPTEPSNASLPPTIIPSYELLGDVLMAVNRKAEAAEAYQKALDLRANRSAAARGLERARK